MSASELATTTSTLDGERLTEGLQPPGGARPVRAAAAYSLASAVQRAIGFLLLPLYTRAISPAEYGALGVLVAVFTVTSIAFSVGLEIAIVRNYFERSDDPERLTTYIDSVRRFLVVYPFSAALVLSVIARPFVGHGLVTGFDVSLTLFAAAFQVAGLTLPLAVLRARQDLRGYLSITAVGTLLTPTLTVLFVVVLHIGLRGYLLSMLLGSAAVFAASAIVFPWRWGGRLDRPTVRAAVAFSLPFLPHTASQWALNLADRSVLAGLVSGTSLGIYNLAANISAPLLMVMMSLNQGFMPIYARAGTSQGHERELRRTVVIQITMVTTLTLACALLGGPIADILTPASYDGAEPLVPWLALGFGFFGLYGVPMNGATLGAGRSKWVWTTSGLAAATNLALLFLFVPSHGTLAAAIASAAGYAILLIGASIWAHSRANPVTYDWGKIVPIIGGAGAIFAAAMVTTPSDIHLTFLMRLIWLMTYVAVLLATRVLPFPKQRGSRPLRPSA